MPVSGTSSAPDLPNRGLKAEVIAGSGTEIRKRSSGCCLKYLQYLLHLWRQIMEPKIIKEEVPDLKESNDLTPPPGTESIQAARRSKGIKSPESPEDGRTNATPPSLSHVTSSLQSTSSPSSTLAVSPGTGNAGTSSPPTTPTQTARPNLAKLKRFLSTLVQFGAEINAELGDKVRNLVFNMVNGSLTIEEFHASLQEATNFPLRPFVLPFLRTHLPLLQKELSFQARVAKQSTSQYLKLHEQLVLDPSFSPSEPSEIFSSDQASDNGKRKHSESIYENGLPTAKENLTSEPQQKKERLHHSQPAPTLFGSLSTFQNFPGNYNFQFSGVNGHGSHQSYSSGFNAGLLGSNFHLLNSINHSAPPHLVVGNSEYTSHQDLNNSRGKDDRSGDEEWKNINTMLNCILSMVEKTKRALSILQTRDRGIATESDVKRAANEIIRVTEDRIGEIKRRAEEAVNEVKRQAIVELEKVVTKSNKAKEDAEESSSDAQGGTQNLCWNCGRKAQETCSGCNIARYCGSYCQHRDWETHHQVCCSTTDRRHLPLGSIRYDQDDRRHLIEERRNILEDRRNFVDDRGRRFSTDENRRCDDRKEESGKRTEKEKEKSDLDKRTENQSEKSVDHPTGGSAATPVTATPAKYSDLDRLNPDVNRNRLLPNISSQILNIDNIRRMKNHVLNREGGEEKSYGENSAKKCNTLNNYAGGGGSQRGTRCRPSSRSGTPLASAAASLVDPQITK